MTETVILADGRFPKHNYPLQILHEAKQIICCDGAVERLAKHNLKPTVVIGDMDSIPTKLKEVYKDCLIEDHEQETNDLTKAVNWCIKNGMKEVTILGATGKREDHTIGNVSLLSNYAEQLNVQMVSNRGIFRAINKSTTFACTIGQRVSIFSLTPAVPIRSKGLKFPLRDLQLKSWWMGTLNETTNKEFTLAFEDGKLIVYLLF